MQASEFLLRDVYSLNEENCVNLKKLSGSEIVRLFLPFVVLLIVGFLGLTQYPAHWRFTSTVHSLSDAALIAGLIGICIECWAASVLIRHTAEELSERLVGYGLPEAAQGLIQQIIKANIVYRDYKKSYRLSVNLADPTRMIVRISVTYKAVNNGMAPCVFALPFAEEGIYKPVIESLQYGSLTLQAKELKFDPLPNGVLSLSLRKAQYCTILPSKARAAVESLAKEEVCAVRLSYVLDMPLEYSDVTAFANITINPTIEALDVPPGMEIDLGDRRVSSEGGLSQIDKAFIPGQHIRVWWRKSQNQLTA
jgi:hypothetical protein